MAAGTGREAIGTGGGGPGTVGVVIVSYFTGPSLLDSLRRVLAAERVTRVVLVDNGNAPAMLAAVRDLADPRLTIVGGHGNVGFAAGCNLGAARLDTELLLLLNPDCLVGEGGIAGLLAAVGPRPHPWTATVRLLEAAGGEQNGARRNAATPLQCLVEALQLYRLTRALPRVNRAGEPLPAGLAAVDAISGAFMLMPMSTWRLLGGMDDRYFLHVEDLDFCRRLTLLGGRCFFWPGAVATHVKGTSAASAWFVERHKIAGFRRYFATHFGGPRQLPLRWAALLVLAAGLAARSFCKRFAR